MTQSKEYRGQRTAQFIPVSIGFEITNTRARFGEERRGGGGEDRAKRGVNATWKRCKLENSVVNGTLSFVLVGIDKESVEFYRETEGAHNVFIVAAILTIDQQSLHDFA